MKDYKDTEDMTDEEFLDQVIYREIQSDWTNFGTIAGSKVA